MTNKLFYKLNSATIDEVSPAVREQRAIQLLEFDRQRRLSEARQDVETAQAALLRVRDTSAEEAAFAAALSRLAEIERECAAASGHQ